MYDTFNEKQFKDFLFEVYSAGFEAGVNGKTLAYAYNEWLEQLSEEITSY